LTVTDPEDGDAELPKAVNSDPTETTPVYDTELATHQLAGIEAATVAAPPDTAAFL
jgi:hypothetical protein